MSDVLSQPSDLRRKLLDILGREWRIPTHEIDCEKPFTAYGVDSITALTISGELEDSLGLELPMTLLWDCPNINALVAFLVGSLTAKSPATLEDATP